MAITRRSILKYGLAGAVILAASGVGLSVRSTTQRTPRRPLVSLDPTTYSILAAISDRILPGGEGFPKASDLEVPEKIDALLATCHPGMQAEVVQVLQLFENALAGFVFDQRFQTFTASPPDVQDEVIASWRSSRISVRRTAYKALHGLVTASYYGSPEVYKLVGYPGPPNFGNIKPADALGPQGVTP